MSSRVLARVGVAVLAATVWSLVGVAGPASAHDQLVESTPTAGEALAAAPTEVVLRFGGDLLDLGGAIVVVDAAERSWTDGDLVIEGSVARIALRADMPDGRYEARWQVVSRDGHPISGIIPFTVGDVTDPPAPPTAPVADPGAGGAEAAGAAAGPTWDWGAMRIVLIGLLGAAIALGGYLVALRVRRRPDPHDRAGGPDLPAPPHHD